MPLDESATVSPSAWGPDAESLTDPGAGAVPRVVVGPEEGAGAGATALGVTPVGVNFQSSGGSSTTAYNAPPGP
jgi:hypothetical protein